MHLESKEEMIKEDGRIMKVDLLEHNERAYKNICRMYNEGIQRVATVQPTGSGKSFLMEKLIEENPDSRFFILSTNHKINNQFKEKLDEKILENLECNIYCNMPNMKQEIMESLQPDYIFLDRYYYEHCIRDSRLGRMKVSDIRKSDILLFYRSLSESGLSAGTVKIIHKIIRPALQLACDDRIIAKNPADGCTKEYREEMEKKYALTFEEEREFLERVRMRPRMSRYYPMYAILLATGMRISEAIGLTWADVDMAGRSIDINHQVQYRMVGGKTQYYASETKTSAGRRVIPMSDELHSLFLEQRKEWFRMKKDSGFEVDGYRDFVFLSHMTGKCMNHNNVRRMMKSIVDMNAEREVKLPNVSSHILRHTACCRLSESGCDIKVLQYLMGQTDIRTTMQTYNHVDLGRVKREMDRLKNMQRHTPSHTPFTPNFTPNCRRVM